jgi:hypothetical protein
MPADLQRFEPWFPRSEQRLEATEALFSEVEAIFGQKLPDDYRALVTQYGGAALHGAGFVLAEESPCGLKRSIERLYGFGRPGYRLDVREQRETFRDRLGDLLLPIGADAGGNQLCLDMVCGDVLFWDHDCPREHLPDWTVERLRRDIGSEVAEASDEEVRRLWEGGANALPWWDFIYRVADDVTSWIDGWTHEAREEKRPLEPRLAALLEQVQAGARYEVEPRPDGTTVFRVFRLDGARQLSMLRGDEWRRLRAVLPSES